MKLTSVLLLAASLQVSAVAYSQSVSISGKGLSLKTIFNSIRSQSGFEFIYDPQLIKAAGTVDIDLKNVPLTNALNECFSHTQLDYEIKYNTIIVKEKPVHKKIIPEEIIATFSNTSPPLQIRGVVLDAQTGAPVAGASIVVKESSQGTVTDLEGKFSLTVNNNTATLLIKHIAYENNIVTVALSSNITIKLKPRAIQLEGHMVTTGMFKRPKESFTGAATVISGEQLRSVSMLNALQAMKVFDPSIRIPDNMQFGSDPNKLPNINLRGTNNFPQQLSGKTGATSGADFMATYATNPNQPLFILDGFEVSLQKLYDLDINRIASFTILKDAAATSLYGSRAANGVIVVDTKQPLPGKLQVSYSGMMQVTAPDLTVYHLLNASDKLEVERLAGLYSQYSTGIRPDADAFYRQLYASRKAAVERGVNTYWLAQPVRTGTGQRHSLYLEGGDQYIRYGLNLGYNNEAGVMKNSNRNNYNVDMNLSYRFKGFLFKNVLSVNYNKANNSNYGNFSEYSRLNQYWTPYDSSGKIKPILESYTDPLSYQDYIYTNPLYNSTLHTINNSEYTNIMNQSMAEWNMGKGFRLSGRLAITKQTDESSLFLPANHTSFLAETDFTKKGSYTRGNNKFLSFDGSLNLDYTKQTGRHIFFNTTSISSAQTSSDATSIQVIGFPTDRLDQLQFGNGYAPNTRPDGSSNVTRRISGFTNFNYSYDNRYSADFGVSADGSSQFGINKRFAPFWSAGAGWNLSKEKFLKFTKKQIDLLRIRATIGTTGSNNFPPYMGITTYGYYTDQSYRGQVGASLMGYGNTDLQWQQTLKKNLGVDLNMFHSRLVMRFDLYRENTNSLILDVNTPPSSGVTSYKQNVGELENTGYEFNATYFAIKQDTKGIYWSFFVNGLHNNTYIKHISNSLKKLNDKNDAGQQTSPQLRFEEGQSPNAIWAVRSKGIDPSTGRELYIKKDGTLTYDWSANDKVVVGDVIPSLQGNFGSNTTYKGITLGIYFNYQYKGQMYNQTLADRVENADLHYQVDERVLLGRWKQPGDQTFFKGLISEAGYPIYNATNATSRFVQVNNFVNLQSVSLTYVLPEKYTRKWKLQNTRIGFIANDIARWSSITIERGLDYPFARNFTMNISTSF
ncbi:SusC/RagA family TonB-linked outer membrane protein [Chitinophaga niastensis]|nr:SusC/RagA family TonB-linked outer membrane protein [Chitinophaga niastensis]